MEDSNNNLIFISYAREDYEHALKLYNALKDANLNPWLDKVDILPGYNYDKKIKEAVKECKFFLPLFSLSSVAKRGYIQREFKMGIDTLEEIPEDQVFVIPIRIDECQIPFEKLSKIHYQDMFPNWDTGVQKILQSMNIKTKDTSSLSVSESSTTATSKTPVFDNTWMIKEAPFHIAVDSEGFVYTTSHADLLKPSTDLLKIHVDLLMLTFRKSRRGAYIYKHYNNGSFITKWGSIGSGDAEFKYPSGIAIDSQGHVYVADLWNNRIQKFGNKGNFLAKWGSKGSGDAEFKNPNGIAIDSQGHVYVADLGNNRIQKFGSEGNFLAKWGSKGSGDAEFKNPNGIAIDSQGHVYVADLGNNRIQKFDSNGRFLTKWGTKGSGSAEFKYHSGIAIDSQGHVYVADLGNNRIQKFDSNGRFLTKWGTKGSGSAEFIYPSGIAIDSQGHVYVADSWNNRIQKFIYK